MYRMYMLIYAYHFGQAAPGHIRVAPDLAAARMVDDADVFDMDTDHGSSVHSRDRHGETQSQAASSTCGEHSSVDCSLDRRNSIDLCRRAVPVIEAEADDICSICLDEFTREDPGMPTVCG